MLLLLLLSLTSLHAEITHWQVSNSPYFDWVIEGLSSDSIPVEDFYGECFLRTRRDEEDTFWSTPISFTGSSACSTWIKPEPLDSESWQKALPYLLPSAHPLKAKLDAMFAKKRHTASLMAMDKAGFICHPLRNWDNIVVAMHPKLNGYLIKTYLDDQVGVTELYELLKRLEGAKAIRQAISDFGYESFFKVPQKWLYALPNSQLPPPYQKHFLLVVEDMKLVSSIANQRKWKKKITKETLDALYLLLTHVGLIDSVYITNIPFAKDGKIAFVDTEHHHRWPVPLHRLSHSLNTEMQEYWNYLIHE